MSVAIPSASGDAVSSALIVGLFLQVDTSARCAARGRGGDRQGTILQRPLRCIPVRSFIGVAFKCLVARRYPSMASCASDSPIRCSALGLRGLPPVAAAQVLTQWAAS